MRALLVAVVLAGCTDTTEVAPTFESCGDSCQPGDFKALWFFDQSRAIELAPGGQIVQSAGQALTFSDLQLENPRDVSVPSLRPTEHVADFRIGRGGDIALFGIEYHADHTGTLHLRALDASANERWATDMPVGIVAAPTPQQFFLSSSVDKQTSISALGAVTGTPEWTINAQVDLGVVGALGAVLPDGGLAASLHFTAVSIGTTQLTGRAIYGSAVVMALAPDGSPRWTAMFQTTNGGSPQIAAIATGPRGEVAVVYAGETLDAGNIHYTLPAQKELAPDQYGLALFAPDGTLGFAVPLGRITGATGLATDGETVYVGNGRAQSVWDSEVSAVRKDGVVWTQIVSGPGRQSVRILGLTANGLLVTASNLFGLHDSDPPAMFELAGVTSRAPQAMFYLEP